MVAWVFPAALRHKVSAHRPGPPGGVPALHPGWKPYPETAHNPERWRHHVSPPCWPELVPGAPRYYFRQDQQSGNVLRWRLSLIQDSADSAPPCPRIILAADFSLLASSVIARTFFSPVILFTRVATSRARFKSLSARETDSTCDCRAISNAAADPIMPEPITRSFTPAPRALFRQFTLRLRTNYTSVTKSTGESLRLGTGHRFNPSRCYN